MTSIASFVSALLIFVLLATDCSAYVYQLTAYSHLSPNLTLKPFDSDELIASRELEWNVDKSMVTQGHVDDRWSYNYADRYTVTIQDPGSYRTFPRWGVSYFDGGTANKMKSWQQSRRASYNSLSALAAYDMASLDNNLRGYIDANKAKPDVWAIKFSSVDPAGAVIGGIGLVLQLLDFILGFNKGSSVVQWHGTAPLSGFWCPFTGFSNTTNFDKNREPSNPMRVFAPNTFLKLYHIRVTEEYVFIYPRYNHMRWIVGVDCAGGGQSYSTVGDSIYIKHYGGAMVCSISAVVLTYDKANYFHRSQSMWRANTGPAIRYKRAGEMAFTIARASNASAGVTACEYTRNYLVAQASEFIMDPDTYFPTSFVAPPGSKLTHPEDARVKSDHTGAPSKWVYAPDMKSQCWWGWP